MWTVRGIMLISTLVCSCQETMAVFSPNVTVRSCTSQRVVIRLENASDGGLIYIQDRSSACKRTTSLQVKNYEFDFDVCSIKYDSKFRVVVQKDPYYQTGNDKVIPVMCLLDTTDLKVSNIIYPEEVLDPSVNKTIRPTVRMRMLTESKDITGGEITLDDKVKMSLTLDDPYIEDFDIKATECTAAMNPIVRAECSMDEELFPNFDHKSQGDLSTTFRAFQPTNLLGEPEIDVTFTCNVAVCKGECHKALCGEVIGWGRKKRESDLDEVIENITCGTTLKVKTALIEEAQAQDDEQVGQCVDRYIVTALATVTIVTLFISWIMCGHIYCKLKKLGKEKPNEIRRKSLTERSIDVARAVGRRLSTMFQLPTGYNFGKSPQMDEVAECEETPPTKRRESVHVSTISDDVIHGICRSDNVYSCQDTSSKTNAEDFESCNCVGNPAIFSDKSLDTIEKQTDNRKDSQPENELALNNILQYGHVVINQNISSDIVRKSRGSSSDLAHIFRSSCSSDRSLLSTSTSRQESVGSVADVIAVSDDVINDDVFMLESYKENN